MRQVTARVFAITPTKTIITMIVVVIFNLTGCEKQESVQTVDWYTAHPIERGDTILSCNSRPAAQSNTPNCENARASSNQEWEREKMMKRQKEDEEREARRAEALRKAQKAGFVFVAFSWSAMSVIDAQAFCQHHGGKLPRINNSDYWDGKNPPEHGVRIDGFGYEGAEFKLPSGYYLTDTVFSGAPGPHAWTASGGRLYVGQAISSEGGKVRIFSRPGLEVRVVCVQ